MMIVVHITDDPTPISTLFNLYQKHSLCRFLLPQLKFHRLNQDGRRASSLNDCTLSYLSLSDFEHVFPPILPCVSLHFITLTDGGQYLCDEALAAAAGVVEAFDEERKELSSNQLPPDNDRGPPPTEAGAPLEVCRDIKSTIFYYRSIRQILDNCEEFGNCFCVILEIRGYNSGQCQLQHSIY